MLRKFVITYSLPRTRYTMVVVSRDAGLALNRFFRHLEEGFKAMGYAEAEIPTPYGIQVKEVISDECIHVPF